MEQLEHVIWRNTAIASHWCVEIRHYWESETVSKIHLNWFCELNRPEPYRLGIPPAFTQHNMSKCVNKHTRRFYEWKNMCCLCMQIGWIISSQNCVGFRITRPNKHVVCVGSAATWQTARSAETLAASRKLVICWGAVKTQWVASLYSY